MRLEQTLEAYRPMQNTASRERIYTIVNLESLSAMSLYTGEPCGPRFTRNTAYFPLTPEGDIGVTHHKKGLGKLKYNEGGVEYGIPLCDIMDKPLKDWRIDKK